MIKVRQAREIILKNISPVKESELLNLDFCSVRISAVDLRAKENIPPFDNSAMDGFAIQAWDSIGIGPKDPKAFEVIADLAAGYTTVKRVGNNQAIRIMTGAPIPKGADSVVMVEDSQKVSKCPCLPAGRKRQVSSRKKEEYVRIFREVKRGENVRYAGEDVKKGELLKSGHIGMLASLGISKARVFRKQEVAILVTGDELVEIRQKLAPGKIRNSNAYSLYSQVLRAGAFPILLGIARDRKEDLRSKIGKGLKADMLLVSGGISVGDYDFVKDVLKDLGTVMKFWRVAMKPG